MKTKNSISQLIIRKLICFLNYFYTSAQVEVKNDVRRRLRRWEGISDEEFANMNFVIRQKTIFGQPPWLKNIFYSKYEYNIYFGKGVDRFTSKKMSCQRQYLFIEVYLSRDPRHNFWAEGRELIKSKKIIKKVIFDT